MAKMVLKELFICSCDDGMFAYKIDKENEKVIYKCLGCDKTMEKTFD